MNPLERLLQDDLNHLVDRLAVDTREGTVTDCLGRRAARSRMSEVETRLSEARLSLLRDYAMWREALQECTDLWALADLGADRSNAPEREAA